MTKVAYWFLRNGKKVIIIADTVAELGRLVYRGWLGPIYPGCPRLGSENSIRLIIRRNWTSYEVIAASH